MTPQRTQDTRALPQEALCPGTLTLMDLGYTDTFRFIEAIERGAHFLVRLKAQQDPRILRVHVGRGERVQARGMRLTDALLTGVLQDDKGQLDLDVCLEKDGRRARARVVAVPGPEGERRWYLTTVTRHVLAPLEVAEAYRLRWRVELLFFTALHEAHHPPAIAGRRVMRSPSATGVASSPSERMSSELWKTLM